jgi:DNA-binding NarL/FixJ family response regulator
MREKSITTRQQEIALLVVRGCTNPEIGAMLGISVNAVKKHVSRLLEALHASNRTELAALLGRAEAA